jgi:hypothetical protein
MALFSCIIGSPTGTTKDTKDTNGSVFLSNFSFVPVIFVACPCASGSEGIHPLGFH